MAISQGAGHAVLSPGHQGGSEPGFTSSAGETTPRGKAAVVGGRKRTQTPCSPGRERQFPPRISLKQPWEHIAALSAGPRQPRPWCSPQDHSIVRREEGGRTHWRSALSSEMPTCIIYTSSCKNTSQMNLNERDSISSFPSMIDPDRIHYFTSSRLLK